jgi:hypothetical protein
MLDLKKAKLNIIKEGDLDDFLGVHIECKMHIECKKDGTVHLTQPHLIDQILKDFRLNNNNVTTKPIPASSSMLLSRHSDSEAFDKLFDYQLVVEN